VLLPNVSLHRQNSASLARAAPRQRDVEAKEKMVRSIGPDQEDSEVRTLRSSGRDTRCANHQRSLRLHQQLRPRARDTYSAHIEYRLGPRSEKNDARLITPFQLGFHVVEQSNKPSCRGCYPTHHPPVSTQNISLTMFRNEFSAPHRDHLAHIRAHRGELAMAD
jgi:hypothetical protein